MARSSRSRRRRRGFTLIEVLLVLAILVIVGSVAVINYFGIHEAARIDAAKLQIKGFMEPLRIFRLQQGGYPPTEQGLNALLLEMTTIDGRITGGRYIEPPLKPDPWGRPYQYVYPSMHGMDAPDIWSCGPDGVPNTDDDIGSWQD